MPTLGHKAYLQLRAKLAAGEFPPGSQLVNRTVSQAIGMSMTPVREAVARLASEGIVNHIPGAGAYVRTITHQELAQLYDLRALLEPYATAEAAKHITKHELEELRGVCREWRAIVEELRSSGEPHATPQQMVRWNDNERRFHELIFQASRNTWLVKMTSDLQLLSFAFSPQRSAAQFLTIGNAQTTYRDHIRMYKALRARDAAGLRQMVARHIRVGRKRVLAFLHQSSTANNTPPASSAELRAGGSQDS